MFLESIEGVATKVRFNVTMLMEAIDVRDDTKQSITFHNLKKAQTIRTPLTMEEIILRQYLSFVYLTPTHLYQYQRNSIPDEEKPTESKPTP